MAGSYVLADTIYQGKKETASRIDYHRADVLNAAVDSLLWQSLASVVVPGLVINKTVKATTWALQRRNLQKLPASFRRWGPSAVGLALIPFIVHPIDDAVDSSMNRFVRPFFQQGVKWMKQADHEEDSHESSTGHSR